MKRAMAIACAIMMFTTGCASGGYKLTRMYAGFVNRQMIIIRIILYIFTTVVFAVTMIIDLVIFNTIDFWEGRVSAGDFNFKEGDKTYFAHHEILPTGLKRSTIHVKDLDGKNLQTVVLNETESKQIEVFVDGKLKMRVDNINDAPVALQFNEKGAVQSQTLINLNENLALR